jgi:hypothetical protein
MTESFIGFHCSMTGDETLMTKEAGLMLPHRRGSVNSNSRERLIALVRRPCLMSPRRGGILPLPDR